MMVLPGGVGDGEDCGDGAIFGDGAGCGAGSGTGFTPATKEGNYHINILWNGFGWHFGTFWGDGYGFGYGFRYPDNVILK